jgi:transmembrane sensor
MSGPEREDKDQLWSEATLWFARMRSPDAEAFRLEFEQWLARGALHRRYYNRAAEYWVDSGSALSGDGGRHDGPIEQDGFPKPRRTRGLVALAAVSAVVAGSAILAVTRSNDDAGGSVATGTPFASARFATAGDERRPVQLADGSLVVLGGATVLKVRFDAATRRLELGRGKARFEVAHEARPFVVSAGGGSVTARGTIFDVALTPDRRVSVRLVRGSIDVRFPAAGRARVEPPTRRLQAGETISFEAAAERASDRPNPSAGTAAGLSARDYRDVRISEIVSEANRRAAVPIRFADPALAKQHISGRFRIDDTGVLAERLATLFDLAVDRSDAGEIVLRPK